MRTLTAAAIAAINQIVTSPGHLVTFAPASGAAAQWSDIGQVTLSWATFTAQDMKFAGLSVAGDARPSGLSLALGNLDSSMSAFILANDIANANVYVYGCDRQALADADVVFLGGYNVGQARIGIDKVTLSLIPQFYSAPFRRVDSPNGFNYATPEGTQIVWGKERLILDRLNEESGYIYATR